MKNTNTNEKKRGGYDIVPKILCVVFAFVLWLYVTQIETSDYEETFNGVAIELENTSLLESESGLYVYSGYGNTANVTVVGRKSDINRYTSDSIRLYADVGSITESGRHSVQVQGEVPSGIRIGSVSVSNITVYTDTKVTKEIDVVAKVTSAVVAQGCELGDAVPDYTIIGVTGPGEIINTIDCAQISLDLGEISSTVSAVGKVELIGKDGNASDMRYVQPARSEIKVTVPVTTTKTVPLKVDYKNGYYNDKNVTVTLDPASVELKGDPGTLEKIDSITVAILDERRITSNVMQVYKLTAPTGTTVADDTDTVRVSIAHKGTSVKAFTVNSIRVLGADKLKYELQTSSLSVQIRGTAEKLLKLTADDITVTVNLSEYNNITGTLSVNAEVSVSGMSADLYPIGEYPVQVKIE